MTELERVTRERDVLARKIANDISSTERLFGNFPTKEWTACFWIEWAREVVGKRNKNC